MAISSDDVLHVARLANLSLSDEEVAPTVDWAEAQRRQDEVDSRDMAR